MFSSSQTIDRPEIGARPRDAALVPINLFFALLPEPEMVAPLSHLSETICGAHRFRGNRNWPNRLHLTLLSVGHTQWDVVEIVRRAKLAAARVRATPFEIALDITESFPVRGSFPFVLGSGDGLHKFTALQKLLAYELACEGFEGLRGADAHMTLMWADHGVDEYPIAPVRWTVRDFVLVCSHVGQSRHDYIGRWPLRG